MTVRETLPASLRWAIRLLVAEAVAAGAVTVFLVYRNLAGGSGELADALAVAGFVALLTSGLAGLAVALSRRRPRARAPAIVLQLLVVMFAYTLVTSGRFGLAVPVGAAGILVATLLLSPGSHRALTVPAVVDGPGSGRSRERRGSQPHDRQRGQRPGR